MAKQEQLQASLPPADELLSLNLDDLTVEALEQRFELASLILTGEGCDTNPPGCGTRSGSSR